MEINGLKTVQILGRLFDFVCEGYIRIDTHKRRRYETGSLCQCYAVNNDRVE